MKREVGIAAAQLRGVARKRAVANVTVTARWKDKDGVWLSADADHHVVVRPSGDIHRVGEDAILVDDGEGGYIVFSLAKLRRSCRRRRSSRSRRG